MKRLLPVFAAGLMLAGCATPFEVNDVNTIGATATPTSGTAFSKALFDEYKAYATYEAKVEFEWDDAAIYARKGLGIVDGKVPEPEKVSDWSFPEARGPELTAARARLMGYLNPGIRDTYPALVAKAQVKFDCWIEEEHENDANSSCRSEFLAIEPQLKPMAAAPAPAPKIIKTFIVYFDTSKSNIDKTAQGVLNDVKKAQAELMPAQIFVSGFTDTVGAKGPNQALSQKRAKAVVDALGKMGVKSSQFDVKAFGKEKLAVPTADNTKEAKNRRVEIYFEK